MNRTKRLLRVVAGAATLALPLTLSGPALADTTNSLTTSASTQSSFISDTGFCLFQYDHENTFGGDSQCFNDSGKHDIKPSLDNRVSSIRNDLHTTMCAYQDKGQKGYKLPVGAGSHFADLARDTAPDGRSWNDRISSVGPC